MIGAARIQRQMGASEMGAANLLPNTIATPEGDNEMPPDVPLSIEEPTPLRPRGDEPHSVQPLQDAEGQSLADDRAKVQE